MKRNLFLITLFCTALLTLTGCVKQADAEAISQTFTLRTGIVDGRMAFIGVGGVIDGVANPDLAVHHGERVRIDIVNGDGVSHDLALPDLAAKTPVVSAKEQSVGVTFTAGASSVYAYLCTVAGHRQAGMEGRLVVTP